MPKESRSRASLIRYHQNVERLFGSSLLPIRDTLLASAQCQNSASRMMTGSGTPKSQRRMPLPMIRSLYRAGCEDAVVPTAVAQHAALGCRQARGEGAE